jgi:hypothetical protein
MRQVVLIPLDGAVESSMYDSIVSGGTSLSELRSLFFVRLYDLLKNLYGDTNILMWGVPSGNKSSEANKWNKINENDLVLFSKNGLFVATAIAKIKFQSENLAQRLWPSQTGTESRQYLFTIDAFNELSEAKGAALNFIRNKRKLQLSDFQVLDNHLVQDFLNEMDLPGDLDSGTDSRAGFGLSAAENKVIEKHSVSIATAYLLGQGFSDVQDVGDTESFDLLASSSSRTLSVEVKGSTGPATHVILTKNEVIYQKNAFPENALLIVSNIVLHQTDPLTASGGEIRFISPWSIEDNSLTPISYDYKV